MANETLIDQLERMKTGLSAIATNGSFDQREYAELRTSIINSSVLSGHIPAFFKACREAIEFRRYMQSKFAHYADRRKYISDEINKLIELVGASSSVHSSSSIRFDKETHLGNGGYGEVYLCHHDVLDMDFAIKYFNPVFASSTEQTESEKRFFREAKILFDLHCDNIVQIYDAGYIDGTPFIRMEYIKGYTLYGLLEEYSLFPFNESLTVIIDILTGLEYAHRKGVIHRDLKPSNVMFSSTEKRYKIIDFGVSAFLDVENHTKLTKTGEAVAGGAYIDPQLQVDPKLRDARSDIYSVGAIWYHILTGQVPSGADITTQLSSIARINTDEIELITKCLSYNIKDRYDSCTQLKNILLELHRRINPSSY